MKFNRLTTLLIILAVLLISLFFLKAPGTGNMDTWVRWADTDSASGIVAGYREIGADYPPLASFLMLVASWISSLFGIWIFLAVKLVIFTFLVLTVLVFWLITRDALLSLLLYGALIVNSIALGHLDVLFAPTLILAFWALKEHKLVLFTCLFSISFLIKWQPLILAPILVVYLLNINRLRDWKQINIKALLLKAVLPFALVAALTLVVFGVKPIMDSFHMASTQSYFSGNAMNFNWIITHFLHILKPDQFGPLVDGQAELIRTTSSQVRLIPQLIFAVFFLFTLVVFFRREKSFKNLVLFSLLGYWAYCMFNPGVHENHIFIVVLLSVLLCWLDRKYLPMMLLLIMMSNINLIMFNGVDGFEIQFSRVFMGIDIALLIAVFNFVVFLIFWFANILPEKKKALEPSV